MTRTATIANPTVTTTDWLSELLYGAGELEIDPNYVEPETTREREQREATEFFAGYPVGSSVSWRTGIHARSDRMTAYKGPNGWDVYRHVAGAQHAEGRAHAFPCTVAEYRG